MNLRSPQLILAPILALSLAGTGFAADPPPPPSDAPMGHHRHMGDHPGGHWDGPMADRTITRAEAQDHAEKLFAMLDVNHDGRIDTADRAARMGKIFDRIDTNHDGMISRDEFIAAHHHMGRGMKPGGPDMPPPEALHDWPPHDRPMHDGPMGPGGHGRWMRPGRMDMGILHEADPDHTGSVTREAFVAAALRLFDKADTDHDGKLTPAERHAAMAAHMHDGHPGMGKWHHHHGPGAGPDGDTPPPPPPPAK